jgi:hypothetical protein
MKAQCPNPSITPNTLNISNLRFRGYAYKITMAVIIWWLFVLLSDIKFHEALIGLSFFLSIISTVIVTKWVFIKQIRIFPNKLIISSDLILFNQKNELPQSEYVEIVV